MDILMEMVAAPGPLSRTALKSRTALPPSKLDAGLKFLTASKVVKKERGPRGRYHLAAPPDAMTIGTLQRAFAAAGGRRRSAPKLQVASPLAGLDPRVTLAQLHGAVGTADQDLCPYYDACVALGGPEGPVIQNCCKEELGDSCRSTC
jgi:hypothetical protein